MSETLDTIHLESLANIVMGQSPDSSSVTSNETGLPFLQGCAEFGRQSPLPNLYCSPPLRVAPSESVLISVRAPVGKTNWADQSYCIGRGLGAVRAKAGQANTHFLKYALEDNAAFLHRRSQGSTFSAIGGEDLKGFPVPRFSFGKQQKIATILQTIDQAIEKTEALIEKYGQIKAGMMHDLFTRGLTPDGKLRPPRDQAPELYQETPIGWIPKEWEFSNLVCKSRAGIPHLKTGPFGSSLKGEHWVKEGHPVITIGSLGEGEFIVSELLFINDLNANRLAYFKLKHGDVVFSRVADVGRSVVIGNDQVDWIMSSNLMRITLDEKRVSPDFLQFQLAADNRLKKQIRQKVNAGGRDVANSDILNRLLFVWPNPNEQNAIVDRAKSVDCRIRAERKKVEKLRDQKSGLMHDLLTGKVPVKVDDPEATHV